MSNQLYQPSVIQHDSLVQFVEALPGEPSTIYCQTYMHQTAAGSRSPFVERRILFTARTRCGNEVHTITIPTAIYTTLLTAPDWADATDHDLGIARGGYLMGWVATRYINWTIQHGLLSLPPGVELFHGRTGFDYPDHLKKKELFRIWLDTSTDLVQLED